MYIKENLQSLIYLKKKYVEAEDHNSNYINYFK